MRDFNPLFRLVAIVASVVTAGDAAAQVGPTASAQRAADPSVSLVSPTGVYQTTVPFDLPPSRNNLPIPFAVAYNGTGRGGAAGIGWDVPISYVRRSSSTWRRKPMANPTGPDVVQERIQLSLLGESHLMVGSPSAGAFVPFGASRYMELRPNGPGWRLQTIDNLEYFFEPAGKELDPDLWLLREIRDPIHGDRLLLYYDTSASGTCGPELNLARVEYTFDEKGRALYELKLTYEPWWRPEDKSVPSPDEEYRCARRAAGNGFEWNRPFDRFTYDRLQFQRSRTLTSVDVRARNNLAPDLPQRTIRRYALTYRPDPDSDRPLLAHVTMTGEEGVGVSLPVASYAYGSFKSAVDTAPPGSVLDPDPNDTAPDIVFGPRQALRMPAHFDETSFASSIGHSDLERWSDDGYQYDRSATRQIIRDFTGDGLPDIVYGANGQWSIFKNVLDATGPRFDSVSGTWTSNGSGPGELHVELTRRSEASDADGRAKMITTETWVDLIDWNGDGRVDVVDARNGYNADWWRVWINHDAGGLISWQAIDVNIAPVRAYLIGKHFLQSSDRLPLKRTRSWPNFVSTVCTGWTCAYEGHPNEYNPPWVCTATDTCPEVPNVLDHRGIDTKTEWELADWNGDSYPDFMTLDLPVQLCEQQRQNFEGDCERPAPYPDLDYGPINYACAVTHIERIQADSCPPHDDPDEIKTAHTVHFLNRHGAFTALPGSPFAEEPASGGGLTGWLTRDLSTPGTPALIQTSGNAPIDLNGDGTLFRVPNNWPDERLKSTIANNHSPSCDIYYFTHWERQQSGFVDINGDGLADYTFRRGDHWYVRFNGGGIFGPERRVSSPDLPYEVSDSEIECTRNAWTRGALIDLDGDGIPEMVQMVDGVLFQARAQAAGGGAALGVTRLISISNGYGATTHIEYANAKVDSYSAHQLPHPEVVVAKVETRKTTGGELLVAPTYQAYGDARLSYDPISSRWTFAGYRRQIALVGAPVTERGRTLVDGVVTIHDRPPLPAAGASFLDHATKSSVVRTAHIEGRWSPDNFHYWLQPGLVAEEPFAESTRTYGLRFLIPAQPVTGPAQWECADLYPAWGVPIGTEMCGSAAALYVQSTRSWQGDEAPPSLRNVLAGSTVQEVDSYGRLVRAHQEGDLRRTDDDICTQIDYAATGTDRPFPSVVSSQRLTDCGDRAGSGGQPAPIASMSFYYDNLLGGQVGRGQLTGRVVDRYEGTTHVDSHLAALLTYTPGGAVESITTTRNVGGPITRVVELTYDDFEMFQKSATVTTSDVEAPLTTTTTVSTWPSSGVSTISAGGVTTHAELDELGRPRRISARDRKGGKWTLSRTTYVDDPTDRVVISEVFPASTPVGQEAGAADKLEARAHLDELGRTRYTQTFLGSDYNQATRISDVTEYDALGRPIFEAAPIDWGSGPYIPGGPMAAPFGTSVHYDRRGRTTRFVSAHGYSDATTSSVANDTFVRSFWYGYDGGQALTSARGADENDPSSAHYGVHDDTWTTASGRLIQRARLTPDGAVLDLLNQQWDRLGRVTDITRFGEPSAGGMATTWHSTFDSLGRRLSLVEPGVAPRRFVYDEDGNEVETSWGTGALTRTVRSRYDGLGRPTERSRLVGNTVESNDVYDYDAGSGRLSGVKTPNVGTISYDYDDLGRLNGRVYSYVGHGHKVVESASFSAGGRLEKVRLTTDLTDDIVGYVHDSAGRVRQVIDARTGRAWFQATDIAPSGAYRAVKLGNGVDATFTFAEDGREELTSWRAHVESGDFVFTNEEYDAAGRVTRERHDTPDDSTSYGYQLDHLGRMTQSIKVAGGWPAVETFSYDALGNLTGRDGNTEVGDAVYTRDAVDPDRLCHYGATAGTGCNVEYDGTGSVILDTVHGDIRKFSYDAAGRL
ncbi:MAG TPA: hypothetical protein VM820_12925, partial [Vicinamibacterales bacterium]|nr:hypothetical protein [Vicinamibacterales bacterium]